MTPISFALEILLDCTTIEKAHKAARKYIKELERGQVISSANPYTRPSLAMPAQAPSTQRILAEMAAEGSASIPAPPPKITGGLIDNGDGTKGKRKW